MELRQCLQRTWGSNWRPGIQRVDPVQAPADADHLAAEMLDQHAVVRLGVPEDQDPGAGGDGSGELPF